MSNIIQSPYLRAQREFPSEDLKQLARQCDQAYIDVASKMNARTIGTFAPTQIITGNAWYIIGNQKQQTLRQVYPIYSTSNINHGINFASLTGFAYVTGSYTDGTNWYGMNPENIEVTATQIQFTVENSLVSGYIILEWISVY